MFSEILRPLLETPGALAAAFFDPQGQVIAEVGDRAAVEVLGTYQSVWLAELGRGAEASGLGVIRELAIDFEGRRTVATVIGNRYYVVAVFGPDGVPAAGIRRLTEVRDRLAVEIR
jgi:hypothetical protein